MAGTKDKMGRPIVVVTGLGVVTSLGAGKTDNWAKLTAGESGIRTITRFSTEGLRTRIAGMHRFPQTHCRRTPISPRNSPNSPPRKRSPNPALARPAIFPGPLFIAVPPIEVEWPQRIEIAAKSGANDKVSYNDLLRACSSSRPITSAS